MPTPLPPACLAAALCVEGDCAGCEPSPAGRDAVGARLALAPALADPVSMGALRQLGQQCAGGAWLSLLDDQAVLDLLAAAVFTGRLQLCGPPVAAAAAGPPSAAPAAVAAEARAAAVSTRGGAGVAITPSALAGTPAAPSAPRSSSSPASALPAAPAAEPEALPAIDEPAMAAVLREAARDGIPFCEECEKARARLETAAA